MDMRVPAPLRAIGFGFAALVVAATPVYATDYFAMDLRHGEFSPEPLGPPAHFVPPAALVPIPVATIREPASTARAVAANAHRTRVTHIREAARRPRHSPLNAFASYPRPHNRPCLGAAICVFDGANGRWYAK